MQKQQQRIGTFENFLAEKSVTSQIGLQTDCCHYFIDQAGFGFGKLLRLSILSEHKRCTRVSYPESVSPASIETTAMGHPQAPAKCPKTTEMIADHLCRLQIEI